VAAAEALYRLCPKVGKRKGNSSSPSVYREFMGSTPD
jgi:hypothetical protein